jgi:hypothetical protein
LEVEGWELFARASGGPVRGHPHAHGARRTSHVVRYRTTMLVNGGTYACSITSRATRQARTMLWKNT